jgi:hypothetical protein
MDGSTDQHGPQIANDRFDLGQFWHAEFTGGVTKVLNKIY